jgi:alpha-ketoglutarate-dependent taurine dioxygenase
MNLEYTPAEVDDTQLNKIKKLEASTGAVIVALEPTAKYARLSQQQLDELQSAERELGVLMVAYERH